MTDDEAMRVLSPLVGAFHGFADDSVETWLTMLRDYRDPDIALAATHEVISTHEGVTVPFATWRQAYMRTSARAASERADEARQLSPSGRSPITLPEYLTNYLVPRLNAGYTHGLHGDTLEDWRRLAERSRRGAQEEAERRGEFAGVIPTGGLVEWFENYDRSMA